MPKTIPVGLQAHLLQDVTTLSTLWKLTRKDGTIYRFTDHDTPIVMPADGTYMSALTYERSAIRSQEDMAPDNMDVTGLLDSTEIAGGDLRAGLYDSATFQISLVNWANPASGAVKLRAGWVGKVTRKQNQYVAELRGLNQALQTQIGQIYQPGCRNDFGDAVCRFVIAPVTYAGTVVAVTDNRTFTVSGACTALAGPTTKTYTANTIGFFRIIKNRITDSANGFLTPPHAFAPFDSLTVKGSAFNDTTRTIRAVSASLIQTEQLNVNTERAGNMVTLSVTTPGYFDFGILTWQSGLNVVAGIGLAMEVKTWVPNLMTLYLPMPFKVQVGDTFSVVAGCDKRISTCIGKFNNLLGPDGLSGGFNGENGVPGQDAALTYPNAT